MARDPKAREQDGESGLDRRSYLKLTGATVASAATLGAMGTAASAAEYRTITVPAGTTKTINVGSGETFENVLIDMTASGASAKITTTGNGWTIRNVGFKGTHPGGHHLIVPAVSDTGGEGLIENVYMGDGQVERTYGGAVWVNANVPHRGTITFRRTHIAHMANNGLYGSGPGAQGAGGVTHVEDSYFYSNNISNIRTNSKRETSYVRNCTVKVDGTTPPCGAGCSKPGAVSNRGVWSWYGRTHVVDSDIQGSLATHDGTITQENTRTGSNADLTPPKGVPMTAEEAASGSGSGGSATGDSGN